MAEHIIISEGVATSDVDGAYKSTGDHGVFSEHVLTSKPWAFAPYDGKKGKVTGPPLGEDPNPAPGARKAADEAAARAKRAELAAQVRAASTGTGSGE